MEAKDCKSLADLRSEIDRIDRELVRLVAERVGYVRRAAELKTRREEILDPARIDSIVAAVKREAEGQGLDGEAAGEAFRAMIERFVAYEFDEFDRRNRR